MCKATYVTIMSEDMQLREIISQKLSNSQNESKPTHRTRSQSLEVGLTVEKNKKIAKIFLASLLPLSL